MNDAWNLGSWILGVDRDEHGISVLGAGKGQLVFLKAFFIEGRLVFCDHNIYLQSA